MYIIIGCLAQIYHYNFEIQYPKTPRLTLQVKIFTKHICREYSIITMIVTHLCCRLFIKPLLKFLLSKEHLSVSMGHFSLYPTNYRCCIIKDSDSMVSIILTVASI